MTRSALSACTLAAIAMAGCTTYYDPPPNTLVTTTSGTPVVSSSASVSAAAAPPAAGASSSALPSTTAAPAFRSGFGIIESMSLVTLPASAAAGGTAPPPPPVSGPYRVALRMDDGTSQTLMVDNRAFFVGDRVQVQPEGRMVRP